MQDRELLSIIEGYREDSLGANDGDLSDQRADALDHYHARPYGDEKQNRSQIVSKDLSETVDWIMPAIMKVFLQSGNIAEFTADSAQTEDATQQESDYVNYVIMQENEGFLVLHDAIKDSLILKNGYFKHYWHEEEKITEEEFEGLTPQELLMISMQLEQKGEIKVKSQKEIPMEVPEGMDIPEDMELPSTYDVVFEIKTMVSRCIIEAVPPEEIRVSKRCRGSLQESYFTEHVTRKTRSELIEMGMDADFVGDLASYDAGDNDDQTLSRDSVVDESDGHLGVKFDRSMDEIEFCEAYVMVDYDGDGIAELRKVVTVATKLPDGDEWNERIEAVPMTGMVPKRIPHRHVGESLDDELEDLQRIKTVLTRAMLDNAYLNSNQEWLVNERVNLNDFLRSTPGGLKRVKGEGDVGMSAVPVPFSPIIDQLLPAINYIDGVKGNRTGVDKSTTMIDPDILKQSTEGAIQANMQQASQKVEMITRLLAETGIKELVLQVQKILRNHQTEPKSANIRGKFEQVTPSQWPERTQARVKVGIGTGTESEKQAKLAFLSQEQVKLREAGLVMPPQMYNLFEDQAKALGFDMPERYAIDPKSPEYKQMEQQRAQQPPPPNPLAEAEKVKGEFGLQKTQMEVRNNGVIQNQKLSYEAQIAQLKLSQEQALKEVSSNLEIKLTQMNNESKETIAAAQMETKAMIEGLKVDIGKPGIGAGMQERTYNPETGSFL